MGAADGPVFATPKPGSKPIISPPCGCPECVAGPGIDHKARSVEARLERAMGPLTKVIMVDFCPSCRDSVITTSVKQGPAWNNTCKYNHTWQSFD